jgi:Family of unknown function (DUF6502)
VRVRPKRVRSRKVVRAPVTLPGPREYLEPLARILVAAGCAPKDLKREFSLICGKLKEPTRAFEPLTSGYVDDLSHVIARWHADGQYIDEDGRPNPLPLKGPGLCLTDLILRVLPDQDPAQAIKSLIELQGIRRKGTRYLPTGKYLALNRRPLAVWVHGLTAVLGFLRTVEHNVTARPGKRLLERVAINPRFPVSALPALHRSLKGEVPEMLWKLDVNMGRGAVRETSKRFTRVGIGFYVFEDPQVTGIAGKRRDARAVPRRHLTRRRRR